VTLGTFAEQEDCSEAKIFLYALALILRVEISERSVDFQNDFSKKTN